MTCYRCGTPLKKPYAVLRWHHDKPPKNYCFQCWNIERLAPEQDPVPWFRRTRKQLKEFVEWCVSEFKKPL